MLFTPQDRQGSLLLLRVKAEAHQPDWLAFKKLFAYFGEKKEISQRRIRLPSGEAAQRADYAVKVKGRETRVTAYALRRAGWIYELAEWGFDRDPPGEAVLASLAFEPALSSTRGSP